MPLEEKLSLVPGDVLRVSVAVPYKGPAHEFTIYGSIGSRGLLWFDEILTARASLPCPDSPEKFTTVIGDLDIEIIGAGLFGVGGISSGNDYDLYVKIEEQPDVTAEIDDVINIAGNNDSNMTGMLGMMMPIMMLGMVMPMVGEGMEE
ncbi:hypothetical protein ACFLUF_02010 [Chloroflexota bacterium]